MREARRLGEDDQATANRQTASLAGLAAALMLAIAGLFLMHALGREATVEDCLLANRLNCDAIVVASP